ncbi:hypothetical protein ACFUN8_28975 [Streptomyces sp. NPDC057307]|uniref:hypothetical protein n=1 Tax=Streptomyces sp. NPDC057307 TaxID=3346096 RepID=UPI003640FFF6
MQRRVALAPRPRPPGSAAYPIAPAPSAEPTDKPTTDGDRGNGDSAEPLDLVGALLVA